jgi:geranylgeranyl diphosphate synthase, type II
MTGAESLSAYLSARRSQIDQALARSLPPACPPGVYEAMRYSLLAGGKRLRPILTLAAAETVAGEGSPEHAVELAMPAACAIEFIHTYSLIHDDLPAMDDDSLRRGRPTNHVVHGEGMAILAGDGLLTEAFALMANEPRDPALAARKLRTIGIVAVAAGAVGMVGGQALDLQAVGAGSALDAVSLQDMHARKTGALIQAAAVAGAVMAGGDDDLLLAVEEYGRHLGLAFQIVDDILDVEGEAASLGKTAGKDARAGKPTYPSLYGLDASRRLATERMEDALACLTRAGLEPGRLGDLAEWVVNRTN